ncbi:MAG: hypothetical protein IPK99_00685 [Flavobacteriales bacterium]|nr:hypothetical protein [Flavobacteriales bacterium]
MALVIIAAIFLSFLFLLFKVFDRRRIPLLPAIVVNYATATLCGLLFSPPWLAGDIVPLVVPSLLLGVLFIVLFYLTGLSTQRVGVAATSVASKMSLVLTVAVLVIVEGELPGALVSVGIALAIAGVICTTWSEGGLRARSAWLLPLVLFDGNAAVICCWLGRRGTWFTPATEAVFPRSPSLMAGSLARCACSLQRTNPRRVHGPGSSRRHGARRGELHFRLLRGTLSRAERLARQQCLPADQHRCDPSGAGFSAALFRERINHVNLLGLAAAVIALVCILAGR